MKDGEVVEQVGLEASGSWVQHQAADPPDRLVDRTQSRRTGRSSHDRGRKSEMGCKSRESRATAVGKSRQRLKGIRWFFWGVRSPQSIYGL
ncbi:unnamed protein product [Durusdinium trenchii]|uniref:Uncharacterized protein n=1 Tax=Durusdinium trenchii TaxID=1381693 RepID=A0ABP0IKL9_9DINO